MDPYLLTRSSCLWQFFLTFLPFLSTSSSSSPSLPSKLPHPTQTRASCQTQSFTTASPQASSSSPSSSATYVRHSQEQPSASFITPPESSPSEKTHPNQGHRYFLSNRHMNWATSTYTTHWQHTSDTLSRWNSSASLHPPHGNPHPPHPPGTVRRRRSRQRKQSFRLGKPRRSPGEMPMPFASRLRLARGTKGRIRPRKERRQLVPVRHSSPSSMDTSFWIRNWWELFNHFNFLSLRHNCPWAELPYNVHT